MSPNVTQKPLAGYPAFIGKRGRYSNRPVPRSQQSLSQVVRSRLGLSAFGAGCIQADWIEPRDALLHDVPRHLNGDRVVGAVFASPLGVVEANATEPRTASAFIKRQRSVSIAPRQRSAERP
jgi:hypothetical protein